jgi:hypothetical protein
LYRTLHKETSYSNIGKPGSAGKLATARTPSTAGMLVTAGTPAIAGMKVRAETPATQVTPAKKRAQQQ